MNGFLANFFLMGLLLPVIPSFLVYYLNQKNDLKDSKLHFWYYLGSAFFLGVLTPIFFDDDIFVGVILISNIIFFVCYNLYNRSERLKQTNQAITAKTEENISKICPHCKNPVKKIEDKCEWCGI
jgi:hypothetical protein